jgi:hypothetical protein
MDRWRRWTAIVVGFCGILLVTRPGSGGIHPAALLSSARRLLRALRISTRVLARSDSDGPQFLFQPGRRGRDHVAVPFYWTRQSDRSYRADVLDGPVQRASGTSC